MDRILEPVPEKTRPPLWIDETAASLNIPTGYYVVLNGRLIASEPYLQLGSSLLHGGATNWAIRVEIFDPQGESPLTPEDIESLKADAEGLLPNLVHHHCPSIGEWQPQIAISLDPDYPLSPDKFFVLANVFRDKNLR